AKGEVAQVIQRGYKIKERVLRAAKVGVSKGAPNSA
ncbi:co-chaperone GrpE protein, partial [Toxoplasma gondii GAB2-2007-GAL-DOM2]